VRRQSLAALALVLAAALAGCGEATAPKPALAGAWSYSITGLTGDRISCVSSGTTLTLTQTGGTFVGHYSGGTITCTISGSTGSAPIDSGVISAGTFADGAVAFDFVVPSSDGSPPSAWHHTGTLAGTSMSGALVLRDADGSALMSGTWTAVRP
jgi:hypothetical protein